MTTSERSELDRAIERAERNGIRIVGRGTLKTSGTRYFITSGKTAQANHDHALHYVRVEGCRLVCDCAARVICTHRAVVHVELAKEHAAVEAAQRILERRQAEQQARYQELAAEDESYTEHLAHTLRGGPVVARSREEW